jgi:uncharacterized sulfatase
MAGAACLSLPFAALAGEGEEKLRPNILWVSVEDMSLNLGCYGDPNAITPTLDQMAKDGIRYGQHLRNSIAKPKHILCFTEYLRKAGYYCTNNSKQDYNFSAPPQAWETN